MSIKKVCDRCNKVKEDEEAFSNVEYTDGNDLNKSFDYDLCPECAKQFRMFINGGTVEEDRYKDSKPCSVVIHKLDNGNYAIANAPDTVFVTGEKINKEEVHHCGTCEWQYSSVMCPRAKSGMSGALISCSNYAVACEKWEPKEKDKKEVQDDNS